ECRRAAQVATGGAQIIGFRSLGLQGGRREDVGQLVVAGAGWFLKGGEQPSQDPFECALRLIHSRNGGGGRRRQGDLLLRDGGQRCLGAHSAGFGRVGPSQGWLELRLSQTRASALLIQPHHACRGKNGDDCQWHHHG